jgi:hypothetical protein
MASISVHLKSGLIKKGGLLLEGLNKRGNTAKLVFRTD